MLHLSFLNGQIIYENVSNMWNYGVVQNLREEGLPIEMKMDKMSPRSEESLCDGGIIVKELQAYRPSDGYILENHFKWLGVSLH